MDFDEALNYAIKNKVSITFQGWFDRRRIEVIEVCTFRKGDIYVSFEANVLPDLFVRAFTSSITAIKKEADGL